MIRTMLCTHDHQLRRDLSASEIRPILADEQSLLWLDLANPTPDDLRLIAGEFDFHPLAIEDATKPHQRPKIDRYDRFYFLVFYAIESRDDGSRIDEHELDIFLGPNYLITVHNGPIAEIGDVAARFERAIARGEPGIGVLLYALLDTIVDQYFPAIEAIGDRVEALEQRVVADVRGAQLREIYALKRELLHLRRVIAPEREVMAVLVRRDLPILGDIAAVYFQDLQEHVLRVTDAVDVYRDLLNDALDAYHSMNANNLNQIMKLLTSVSIILMSVALIPGIYGMNFENMPELRTHYGYFVALGAMAVLGLALMRYFRRNGWL
jgi:magnesium transporter